MSKILRPSDFGFRVTMEWPSGDQRGENIPTDPGRVVTWLLSSSRMQMTLFGSSPASLLVEKTIFRPSGDQFASVSGPASPGRSSRGVPP
jgi:hypothetical protein